MSKLNIFAQFVVVPYTLRHGVRHDFFLPPKELSLRKGVRLLFVGQWLRETLCRAMDVWLDGLMFNSTAWFPDLLATPNLSGAWQWINV